MSAGVAIDLRKYLDRHGWVRLDLTGRARSDARRFGLLVELATAPNPPAGQPRSAPIRCFRHRAHPCLAWLSLSIGEEPGWPIGWQCPECGDQGRLLHWQQSHWNLADPAQFKRRPSLAIVPQAGEEGVEQVAAPVLPFSEPASGLTEVIISRAEHETLVGVLTLDLDLIVLTRAATGLGGLVLSQSGPVEPMRVRLCAMPEQVKRLLDAVHAEEGHEATGTRRGRLSGLARTLPTALGRATRIDE